MKIIQHFILSVEKKKNLALELIDALEVRRKESEDLLLVCINEENGEESQ